MKIAFYIPILNVGGAEKVIINLLKQLHLNHSNQYFLITDEKNSIWINEVRDYVTILDVNSNVNLIRRLIGIKNAVKVNKIDILVSHLTHSNIHCVFVKIMFPIKLVLVEHSITSTYVNGIPRFRVLFGLLIKFLFKKADKIVSVSKATQDDLVNNFNLPLDICQVVYNPIDFKLIKNRSLDVLPPFFLDNLRERRYIVSIGRLEIYKNHIFLIESLCDYLVRENVVLVLVGGGVLESKIKSKIKELNLLDYIFLTGYDNNPYPYLFNATLLIHPARFEGFGLVLIEALYLSKPVISMNFEAAYEVLELGRLGSIVSDKESMISALSKNLEEKSKELRYLDEFSKHVECKYNLNRIAKDYLKIFQSFH